LEIQTSLFKNVYDYSSKIFTTYKNIYKIKTLKII